jgi:hypothetical protein
MLLLFAACLSCNNNKPKPTSNDITKTVVAVNGKKDSVVNNPQKNYGNATVAEPCVKCLIQVVQSTYKYKASVKSSPAAGITYIVNWAEGTPPADTSGKHSNTNALRLDVLDKGASKDKIASFIYNNTLSKLFFVATNNNIEIKLAEMDLRLIRNRCYWGVASSK